MPVELQVIRSQEFVRLDAQGEFDFEETCAVLKALADACRKRGIERALVDVRGATSRLTPDDLAALVNAFSEVGFSGRLRLGILHTGNQNYRARLFAFFSAMHGRHVRSFEDFEEGLAWLSRQDDPAAENTAAQGGVPIRSGEDRTKIAVKEDSLDP